MGQIERRWLAPQDAFEEVRDSPPKFVHEFPEAFSDTTAAPLLARTIYFRLKERWDRFVVEYGSREDGED
jgi:hypothetical protein